MEDPKSQLEHLQTGFHPVPKYKQQLLQWTLDWKEVK